MNGLNQSRKTGCASFPCTCGELFQGTLEGEPCLVSCPIDIFSQGIAASAHENFATSFNQKVQKALDIFSPAEMDFEIRVSTPLPVGRGYGTSTADIGAALFAASQLFQTQLTDQQAARIALQVEPTDSTFFRGLSLFDHRQGKFQQYLGEALPAGIIILDPGGMVDTEAYNRQDLHDALTALKSDHLQAFNLLRDGIAHADLFALSEASTLSARIHQTILNNPLIEPALSWAKQLGAAGICRAHSGTIVGLLFPANSDLDDAIRFLAPRVPDTVQIRSAALIGGGVTTCKTLESETIFNGC